MNYIKLFPDKNLLVSSESRLNCCNPRTKDFRVLNIEQRVQSREIVYLLLSHEGRVQIRLRTVGNKEGKYSPESVVSENSRTSLPTMLDKCTRSISLDFQHCMGGEGWEGSNAF